MIWIFPLTLLIIFELVADIFSEEYALKGHWYFWAIALAAYMIGNIFWLSAMKNGSHLSRGAIIFSVGSAIAAVIVGIFFFHESTNKIQLLGMFLGIISMILIFWE